MRSLLVAALLAGCHHAPPARPPAPIAAQPAPHRGPGRADVDPGPAAMPLAETVSTTRPCVEPTSDPQPSMPGPTPISARTLYLVRGPSRCAAAPTPRGGRRVLYVSPDPS